MDLAYVEEIPNPNIIDPVSGYSASLPLGNQDYPGWTKDRPEIVERIKAIRVANGIVIDDDMLEGDLPSKDVHDRQGSAARERRAPRPRPRP